MALTVEETTSPHRGTVGIIGAGKSGVAIARLALDAGYTVEIASSGGAAETALMIDIVAPGAIAVDVPDIAAHADILVLAVPLRRFREIPAAVFDGRTVIDVMNYWPPIDGVLEDFEQADRPSSSVVQDALPTARVVKTLNHLGYHQMEDLARPAGDADRIALGVASDDDIAARLVAKFIDTVGFDAVPIGTLSDSGVLQPEMPLFGAAVSATALQGRVAALVR